MRLLPVAWAYYGLEQYQYHRETLECGRIVEACHELKTSVRNFSRGVHFKYGKKGPLWKSKKNHNGKLK